MGMETAGDTGGQKDSLRVLVWMLAFKKGMSILAGIKKSTKLKLSFLHYKITFLPLFSNFKIEFIFFQQ